MAISPQYYTKDSNNDSNVQQIYLGGLRRHYLHKDRSVVLSTYTRELSFGESAYSLAKEIFGEENQYLWTIISDINILRFPEDWEAGDVLLLPEIIVSDVFRKVKVFTDVKTSTAIL